MQLTRSQSWPSRLESHVCHQLPPEGFPEEGDAPGRWGWHGRWKSTERCTGPECPVPDTWRLCPHVGCHSSTQAGVERRQVCTQRLGEELRVSRDDPPPTRHAKRAGLPQSRSAIQAGRRAPQVELVCSGADSGPLTFSLCRALFSSPSTCRSFLATPMQGRSVRTPRWQATPKPVGAEQDEAGEVRQ